MCRSVTCRVCGKTTWAGCGQHIDQVKRTVPAGNWCPGHDRTEAPTSTRRPGLLARLFGR
ncbi:hypothetical protein [Citricoccus nitrophenolicus]|uniref:hypothetical protein n=1 Tax=Citricoccus nitrophenolicus TaxID=863575 RepID=UPI0039B6C405